MQDPFALVADFNREIIGLPKLEEPTRLSQHRKGRRLKHIVEELKEFHDAATGEDEVDALVDIIYIAMGALYEMGVDGRQHFLEVHSCNMNRVRGYNGRRPDEDWDGFDAVKPAGWVGPDHTSILCGTKVHVEPEGMEISDELVSSEQPKLVLVGHGRHGKDTAAEMLRDRWGFKFCSSSLFCAEKVMMPAFKSFGLSYADAQACFDDRHGSSPVGDHRTFWFKRISEYNHPDKARLAVEMFEENDIYVGIRDRRELWALKLAFPDALVVWVDAANRLPPEGEGSMNIEPWMADVVLDNNGDLEQLGIGVDRLAASL